MRTLGIDFAAQPKNTAVCQIEWGCATATVSELVCDVDDDQICRGIERVDKAGLDVPLGWPVAFVQAIRSHSEGRTWPHATSHELRFRATDRFVQRRTRHWPLSVSTDLISVAAMRAASVLARLDQPVDRAGKGKVVEVYPAAALRIWGFEANKYKGKDRADNRCALLQSILESTNAWLRVSDSHNRLCEYSDNALDALIAALVARASACNLVEPIPEGMAPEAEVEGWIALPATGSLGQLFPFAV
jgi:predicted nuclease with RNAse H fold